MLNPRDILSRLFVVSKQSQTQSPSSLQDVIMVRIQQRAFIFRDKLPRRCVGLERTTGTPDTQRGASSLHCVTTTALTLSANRCVPESSPGKPDGDRLAGLTSSASTFFTSRIDF